MKLPELHEVFEVQTTSINPIQTTDANLRGLDPHSLYFPISKVAWRRISQDSLTENTAVTLVVYVALCWEASQIEAETLDSYGVQLTKGFLASGAGVSKRSVETAIRNLERVGAIKVVREPIPGTKGWAVNRYFLV